jgi:hypothetical protein
MIYTVTRDCEIGGKKYAAGQQFDDADADPKDVAVAHEAELLYPRPMPKGEPKPETPTE